MQLAQSFEVAAPIDRVWQALIDIERVAPCLPGATITGRADDGTYEGAFTVKIGPTSASYTGKLEMLEVDEGSRRAMMHATGTDKRGQGGASATIVSKLTESAAGGTHVEVQTDYRITGRLARFGRGGMIEDISERLLRQFADNLAASLRGEADGKAAATAAASPEAEVAGPPVQEPGDGAPFDGPPAKEPGHVAQAAPLPPLETEPPDLGKLATEAMLARVARHWSEIAFASAAAIFLFGAWRQRRRRS
jgi:carbon monoxide dehydrogenase subunit G